MIIIAEGPKGYLALNLEEAKQKLGLLEREIEQIERGQKILVGDFWVWKDNDNQTKNSNEKDSDSGRAEDGRNRSNR